MKGLLVAAVLYPVVLACWGAYYALELVFWLAGTARRKDGDPT